MPRASRAARISTRVPVPNKHTRIDLKLNPFASCRKHKSNGKLLQDETYGTTAKRG